MIGHVLRASPKASDCRVNPSLFNKALSDVNASVSGEFVFLRIEDGQPYTGRRICWRCGWGCLKKSDFPYFAHALIERIFRDTTM